MRKELGTFILLVLICVVLSIKNPNFLSPANLQNLARLIGMYGIFSIGIGTTSFTIMKAAKLNPVKTLRTE